MTETTEKKSNIFEVATSPHVHKAPCTTGLMVDVLIALLPLIAVAGWVFGWMAARQIAICLLASCAAEWLFMTLRGKPFSLKDGSAAVTGIILALSLPATAPWFVGVIGSVVGVGLGKVIFGGLGFNIFNPAMVGRAFVMIAFPAMLGASAYILPDAKIDVLTMATPLTAAKMEGVATAINRLLLGNTNGSIGETSAIACLIGGLYLCIRKTASWQIPAGVILSSALISLLASRFHLPSVAHELAAGALLFGAFFIATDPVTSPVTPKGRWVFGIVIGCLIMTLRKLSGYPEGVMFAVLLANGMTPLINRWTVPTPVGGPVPVKKG